MTYLEGERGSVEEEVFSDEVVALVIGTICVFFLNLMDYRDINQKYIDMVNNSSQEEEQQ